MARKERVLSDWHESQRILEKRVFSGKGAASLLLRVREQERVAISALKSEPPKVL